MKEVECGHTLPLGNLMAGCFLPRAGRCESALPAAVLDTLLVRPSRNTLDATLAARAEVTLLLFDFAMQIHLLYLVSMQIILHIVLEIKYRY